MGAGQNEQLNAGDCLSAYLDTAAVFNSALSDLRRDGKADFSAVRDKMLGLIGMLKQNDRFLMGIANTPYSVLVRRSGIGEADADIILYGLNLAIYSLSISLDIGVPDGHLPYIGMVSICNHLGLFSESGRVCGVEMTETTEISRKSLVDAMSNISISDMDMDSLALLSGLLNDEKNITGKTSVQESMYQYAIIISLCSSFEKLMHKMVKGEFLAPADAMKSLRDNMDSYFNRNIIKIFFNKLSIYPVGTFVRLNTREAAKIVDINPGLIMRPVVMIVLDTDELEKIPPVRMNLKEKPTIYIKHSLLDEMLSEKYLDLF